MDSPTRVRPRDIWVNLVTRPRTPEGTQKMCSDLVDFETKFPGYYYRATRVEFDGIPSWAIQQFTKAR